MCLLKIRIIIIDYWLIIDKIYNLKSDCYKTVLYL